MDSAIGKRLSSLVLLRQTRQPLVRPLRSLTAAGAAVEGLGEADRQRAEHGCQ